MHEDNVFDNSSDDEMPGLVSRDPALIDDDGQNAENAQQSNSQAVNNDLNDKVNQDTNSYKSYKYP